MLDFLIKMFRVDTSRDPSLWHKSNVILPVRLTSGAMSASQGQLWRRQKADGTWEYQQDAETEEEFLDRQV